MKLLSTTGNYFPRIDTTLIEETLIRGFNSTAGDLLNGRETFPRTKFNEGISFSRRKTHRTGGILK